MAEFGLSAFAWKAEGNVNFVVIGGVMKELAVHWVQYREKAELSPNYSRVVGAEHLWQVATCPCVVRVCTGINELNGGGICQQRDMEMLPTASHRSATICSQRFATLREAENCIILLMLKLVEKLAFVFSLDVYCLWFRIKCLYSQYFEIPWILQILVEDPQLRK